MKFWGANDLLKNKSFDQFVQSEYAFDAYQLAWIKVAVKKWLEQKRQEYHKKCNWTNNKGEIVSNNGNEAFSPAEDIIDELLEELKSES